MRGLLAALRTALVARAVTPLIVGFFLILYIGTAFVTDEALTTLIEFTRRSVVLAAVFAFVPLSLLARLVRETAVMVQRRRLAAQGEGDVPPGTYDEIVSITRAGSLDGVRDRLAAAGYTTRRTGTSLAAWRGVSLFPARVLLLAGGSCLFAGILLSLTSRGVQREAVIEGEPFPLSMGGGRVERIDLRESSGPILERSLAIEVASEGAGGGRRSFGLYPPGRYHGYFVYPRYLGIAPQIRFSAPDFPTGFETHFILMIYPPGKEDSAVIPGTAYRIVFSMAAPEPGNDPFVTGRITLRFRIMRGEELLHAGKVPVGGEYVRDGYRLSFPDFRRIVATDFIRDQGVPLVWGGAVLLAAALLYWVVVRPFFPRREMLFVRRGGEVRVCSRAEGRVRSHAGVFHEALDALEPRGGGPA
jgi:hypothetical protein